MRWKALVLPLPFLMLLAATATPAPLVEPQSVADNETVFAELGAGGEVQRVILVDWIRVVGNGRIRIEDALPGRDAKPLAGTARPRREDDRLVWDVDVEGSTDLFVTANPQQELPVDVKVRYLLDGREVPPDQAQGAKGKVRVEGTVRNRTDPFVPLLANVSLALPIASFRSLDHGEATAVGVGRTVRLSYILTPRPEGTFAYEIDTERARLPATQLTVLPQALPGGELADALGRLRGTIEEMQSGVFGSLSSGASGLASGASLGSSAASSLAGGLGGLGGLGGGGIVRERIQDRAGEHPLAADLARAIGTRDRPGDARALASALGGPDRQAGRALAGNLQNRFPSLPDRGELVSRLAGAVPSGPLAQLAAGLAQIQAAAGQLQAALARIDQEGMQTLLAELETAGAQLGTPEEARRAEEFDTFTGKPPGADGEVRFVYRIGAPQRRAAAAPVPQESRSRGFWERVRDLLPGD